MFNLNFEPGNYTTSSIFSFRCSVHIYQYSNQLQKKTGDASKNHHILCANTCPDEMYVGRIDSRHCFQISGWMDCLVILQTPANCHVCLQDRDPPGGQGADSAPSPWDWSTGPGLCKRPVCKTKVESFQILETADVIARSIIPGRGESNTKNTIYIYSGSLKSPQSCTL